MESRDGYPFVFTCRRSGNCCALPDGTVDVSEVDVARIAEHLGMSESATRSRYLKVDGTLADGPGNRCVFLDDGGQASCRIYSVRPDQCRQWPFWKELADDPEALRRAMRTCPGIVPSGQADTEPQA